MTNRSIPELVAYKIINQSKDKYWFFSDLKETRDDINGKYIEADDDFI